MCEGIFRDAQIRSPQVIHCQPGVLVSLVRNRIALRVAQRIAFQERGGERTHGKAAHLIEERLERGRLARQHVVIPGHRRIAGQIHGIRPIVPGQLREDRLDVGRH